MPLTLIFYIGKAQIVNPLFVVSLGTESLKRSWGLLCPLSRARQEVFLLFFFHSFKDDRNVIQALYKY